MRRREIHYRREPSRAATWIAGILITLIGGGVIVTFINTYQQNPSETKKTAVLFALILACVGTIILALKVKAWVRNVWWPRFVERQMMAILGDSVARLREETGKVEIPAVWSSSLKNAILEAMYELASRDRKLTRLRQVADMPTEHERPDQNRRALQGLIGEVVRVMKAINDTPGRDLVRQDAAGNTVPDTGVLARTRCDLGVGVIATAVTTELPPDEILKPWAVMGTAAMMMLFWHRQGSRPLPKNWVRAIESRIVTEKLKRRPPHKPTEPTPA